MEKICFIVNSQKKGLENLKSIIKHQFESSFEVGFLYTTGYRNAELLAQTAIQLHYNIVIAVGGDGTINEVVNGILRLDESLRKEVVLGALPWGTGNDFARTIGATSSVEALYEQIVRRKYMPIDVVRMGYADESGNVNERYFNNIADIGIGPDTLITVGKISKWVGASLAFMIAAVKALFFLKPHHVKVASDNGVFEGKVKCVCIANGRYFGSGIGIAPLAKLNDGYINLVIVEDVSALDFIKLAAQLRSAKPISHPKVHYVTTTLCNITAQSRELPLEVDGEVVGYAPIRAEVVPGCIRFLGDICPSRQPEQQPSKAQAAVVAK